MQELTELLTMVSRQLRELAQSSAVVAKPVSLGNRHVVPLCELALAFAGGGGKGESTPGSKPQGTGSGAAAGGGAKATPVALVVIEDDEVRLEALGL